jgi:hypothetical protein
MRVSTSRRGLLLAHAGCPIGAKRAIVDGLSGSDAGCPSDVLTLAGDGEPGAPVAVTLVAGAGAMGLYLRTLPASFANLA